MSSTSTTPSSSTENAKRTLILGVVLAVVGVLLVGGIVYATLRFRRRRGAELDTEAADTATRAHGATIVDPTHPAARITPFGSPGGELPRYGFAHTPGSNMRIANRRSDGGWEFSDTRAPFRPSGVSEIDAVPASPSASSFRSIPRLANSKKDQESKRDRDKADFYDMEPSVDVIPPPAYGEETGYTGHL